MVVSFITKVGLNWYLNSDGVFQEITEEAATTLIEEGTPYVDAIASGLGEIGDDLREGLTSLGEGIVDVGQGVGEATLNVIENSGIALMKAAGKTRDYFVQEIGDRRVQFVKQLTILIIVLMTTVFIYNSLMMKDR